MPLFVSIPLGPLRYIKRIGGSKPKKTTAQHRAEIQNSHRQIRMNVHEAKRARDWRRQHLAAQPTWVRAVYRTVVVTFALLAVLLIAVTLA